MICNSNTGLTEREYDLFKKFATTFGFVGIFKAFIKVCTALSISDFELSYCNRANCTGDCAECIMEYFATRACDQAASMESLRVRS